MYEETEVSRVHVGIKILLALLRPVVGELLDLLDKEYGVKEIDHRLVKELIEQLEDEGIT